MNTAQPSTEDSGSGRLAGSGKTSVAGTTAYAAVRAVALNPGDTVAIAGAAGGVGTIAVQLAKRAGATVLGIAGPSNDDWLTAHGVVPVNYGDGIADRLRDAAPNGQIDAFLDFFGGGYVELAVTELGIDPLMTDATVIRQRQMGELGKQDDVRAAKSAGTAAMLDAINAAASNKH